jgi:hypothetical protein
MILNFFSFSQYSSWTRGFTNSLGGAETQLLGSVFSFLLEIVFLFLFVWFFFQNCFFSWGLNLFFWSLFKWFLTFSDLGFHLSLNSIWDQIKDFLQVICLQLCEHFWQVFVCLFGFVVELTGCWIHLILEAGSTYFWCKWVGTWIEFHVVDRSVLIFFSLQRKKKSIWCVWWRLCIVVDACSLVYYRPAAALEYYWLLSFWIWCSSAASLGNPRPWILFSWLLLPCLWTSLQQRLGPWATLQ